MTDEQNYQIIKLVASGGTAVLYKALQTSLERVVAVKKLHQHLTDDENFTRRFVLEAKAAASLNHENIVKIIDFGVDNGSYHIVMEYIEGESLRNVLDEWKQIPVDLSLAIIHQVCQGLEHAHAKGIVHRDIKPGNIMMTKLGQVKITDFGLAKMTETTTQHTAANSILGTPLYMSPEQAFGESVDHRSDLFSLGTVLYETLTGQQPFRGDNYMGVIHNIIHRNAPHPSRFNVEIPTAVESIILKAMNKSREARFQNAAEFRKAIEKYLGIVSLKEACDNVKNLLNKEGATVVLPGSKRRRTRGKGIRGRVIAAVSALVIGAAGLGMALAPDAIVNTVKRFAAGSRDAAMNRGSYEESSLLGGSLPDSPLAVVAVPDSAVSPTVKDSVRFPAVDTTAGPAGTSAPANPAQPAPKPVTQAPFVASAGGSVSVATPDGAQPPPKMDPPTERTETAPPAPKKGWLVVLADPWAEIYINGRYRADSPPEARIELASGTYTLECRNPKFETYEETLRITPGELSNRRITLKKLTGTIQLTTLNGAEVYVDGRFIGITPLSKPLELDAGRHLITVKKAGFNVWNNEVVLDPNRTMSLNITLSPIY